MINNKDLAELIIVSADTSFKRSMVIDYWLERTITSDTARQAIERAGYHLA